MTTIAEPAAPAAYSSRRPTRHTVTMTTLSPLHHGAFGLDAGNVVLHRRVPLASAPSAQGIPAVSGNAWRGRIRRHVMRDLFVRVGLSRESRDLTPAQWDKLYGALANGGHLTGSETTVKPEDRRALRVALPALSVFGAALYTFMLPGRVSCGWLYPVCAESIALRLVDGVAGATAEELVTEVSHTRHVDREEQDPEASGVTPMPVTLEALMPGVELRGEIVAQAEMADLEWGVVAHGLGLITSLGGKEASGFGRVRVTHTIPESARGAYEQYLGDPVALEAAREALVRLAQGMVV